MYDIILTIQLVNILGLFTESLVVFRRWKNKLHGYLFLSCSAALVNNLGYFLELQTHSREAYTTSLKLSYAGRIWTGLALMFFIAELCRVRMPSLLKTLLFVVHIMIYGVILTLDYNGLYYRHTDFCMDGYFPVFTHTDGIVHHLYMALLIVFIIAGITMLVRTLFKETNRIAKKRLLMVLFAIFAQSVFFIIQTFDLVSFTDFYDFTMPGFSLGTLFMFIAIFRCDLLGTGDIAREFMIDRVSEGVIAVDEKGAIQYFNEPAGRLYPELKLTTGRLPEEITQALESGGSVTIDGRVYKPEENELIHGGENFGKLYLLVDETEHHHLQTGLKQEIGRQTARADRLSLEMMIALSKTVDAKDHYTNGHSGRVAEYSAEIARRMGKSLEEQEKIYEMGLMHDIGKIGVSEDIINKTTRLTDEEFAEIKKHTVIGYDILRIISEMPDLSIGARSHHEKYNGTGYPDGLKGEEIPEAARIICVADCYDAMTSMRTYSSAKPQEYVREEFVKCSGTQFDPEVAKIMLQMIDDDKEYKMNEQGGASVWLNKDKLWSSTQS